MFDMTAVQLYQMAAALLYYLDVLQLFQMGQCSCIKWES